MPELLDARLRTDAAGDDADFSGRGSCRSGHSLNSVKMGSPGLDSETWGFQSKLTIMNQISIRCLILACGNTLREDDGVGPFLAHWAEERWRDNPRVRVLCDHQWTPEMVEEVAQAESVIFVDCATDSAPGEVRAMPVEPAVENSKIGTHHLEAGQLLALSRQLY